MRKSLTAAMAALTFGGAVAATAVPAQARPHDDYGYNGYNGYDRHRHSNNTGAAVAAGVLGLALGAALASSNGNHNSGYYSRGYAYNEPYYGNRHYRGDYYRGGYGYGSDYGYSTCESSRWVWDPYIRERVLIRSHYAC
jgi:hypothetical protein